LAIALGLRRRSSARGLLLGLLGSEDGRTRANACRALGWEANPADAHLLVERLRDDDAAVREAAKTALLCLPAPVVAAATADVDGPQVPR
jgi:HEAT repeat protein